MTVKEQKVAYRTQMLKRRKEMSMSAKRTADKLICEELLSMIIEREIKVLHTYLPMKAEVNVIPLIEQALPLGVTIVVPKTLPERQLENRILTDLKNMERGVFGTYHPQECNVYNGDYDMIIVAGLAFSNDLYRVGYGGGYYDSFLAHQRTAYKVGVGYAFQMVESVPTESHDIQLDEVIFY